MSKTINVKVIKGFEILPGHKYLIVVPDYIFHDNNVGASLFKLFEGSPCVALAVKDPEGIKVVDLGEQKDVTNAG